MKQALSKAEWAAGEQTHWCACGRPAAHGPTAADLAATARRADLAATAARAALAAADRANYRQARSAARLAHLDAEGAFLAARRAARQEDRERAALIRQADRITNRMTAEGPDQWAARAALARIWEGRPCGPIGAALPWAIDGVPTAAVADSLARADAAPASGHGATRCDPQGARLAGPTVRPERLAPVLTARAEEWHRAAALIAGAGDLERQALAELACGPLVSAEAAGARSALARFDVGCACPPRRDAQGNLRHRRECPARRARAAQRARRKAMAEWRMLGLSSAPPARGTAMAAPTPDPAPVRRERARLAAEADRAAHRQARQAGAAEAHRAALAAVEAHRTAALALADA